MYLGWWFVAVETALFENNNVIKFDRNGDGLLTTNVLPSWMAMIALYNTFFYIISDGLI